MSSERESSGSRLGESDESRPNGGTGERLVDRVLAGGGAAGQLARATDWSRTALGPVEGWSQALRSAAALMLSNHSQMLLWWGPEFVQIYNDAYTPVLGDKHPRAMGQPFSECWAEIFHIVGPMADRPYRGGAAVTSDDIALPINRKVHSEESHFRIAYSPVPDETVQPTGVGGVLAVVTEITELVYGERQLRTLGALSARSAAEGQTAEQACAAAAATLAENPWDVPFALVYLLDRDGRHAHRAASVGFDPADLDLVAPAEIDLDGDIACHWPVAEVAREQRIVTLEDLSSCPVALPASPWNVRPRAAIALPLSAPGQATGYGVLVCGVNPHRLLDAGYRTFFDLATAQIVTAIRNARALEEERQRTHALAQIDKAKTTFFSNISHEFRTPLTLMLGPTEDALDSPERVLAGSALETVHRNELRLLKLVNTLLEFSRIEAGRAQAAFEPIDLAGLTRDLASAFRSAIERGGLSFEVDCPPLPRPVHVDRVMWEKIVLNLLSNALKFTFEGSIKVTLRATDDRAELRVSDTGTGIAPADMSRVFERFHRIEGARARTHEGSGIGLAMVNELVRLHGGEVGVASELGRGTSFTVSVPFGRVHLPERRTPPPRLTGSARQAESFVTEALRWLPDGANGEQAAPPPETVAPAFPGARVLFADDNADMRDYVGRLLRQHWTVQAVTDGAQALEAARKQRPDVILTDVMMPNLDGIGLLHALRADPDLAAIPVILLSARAGEESRIEGLDAGANDYLVKPFSARELVARVGTQITLARLREESTRERSELLAREQAARREAETATRAKDEFLAMLGHELRNPLSPILTAVQLMRMRGRAGPEVDLIDRQLGHLMRLVDDLLDVSRIAGGKIELRRQRVELASVALRGLETSSPLLEQRRQKVDFNVPAEGLLLDADPDRMAQVISNLITNASKYSEPGAKIQIAAERAGRMVHFRVTDTGIGIAPDMLDKVFELFVQQPQALDRSKGGLGLGLTIVRSLVELHGGTVRAYSPGPGRGSEFTVVLPLVLPIEELDALPARNGTRANHGRHDARVEARKVLIVDDNGDVAQSIAEVLGELGHEVQVAHDGPSALAVASRFRPDVCLLDIGLPVMDGYELARRLRESQHLPSGARIIAITGYGQDADRERSSEAGFSAHVVKPVDLDVLTSVVN